MRIVRPFDVVDSGGFSRASTGTYFDKDGVLQTAAIDEPRWQWNPATGEFEGLLIEAQRTNFLTYSEQFGNAAWSKVRSTVTANAATAPDGTSTADKIVEDTTVNNTHYAYAFVDKAASSATYTNSIFAKADERTQLQLLISSSIGGNYAKCIFDLSNGTAGAAQTGGDFSGTSVAISNVGNGWYRCSITAASDSDTRIYGEYLLASSGSISYTGNGTSGLYIWGAQLESGDSMTSYIQTTSTQVTRSADVLTDVMQSDVAEADHPEWSAATTYAVGDYVIKSATHRIYRSLQAANLNHDPATEADPLNPVWWVDYGATNRWRMFDGKVGQQTSNADVISVVITPTERADSVVLLNVDCQEVQITVTDQIDGVVFDQSYSMVSDSGIQDYYSYCFEPIVRKSELFVTGLPPYIGSHIQIALIDEGGTAKCGECIVGMSREIGGVQYGASVGIRDYSVKTEDDFGNKTVLERAYSDRGNFTVWAPRAMTREIKRLLTTYRATPVVYVGSENMDETIVYGFYRDFDIVLSFPDVSICNIEIEGLI